MKVYTFSPWLLQSPGNAIGHPDSVEPLGSCASCPSRRKYMRPTLQYYLCGACKPLNKTASRPSILWIGAPKEGAIRDEGLSGLRQSPKSCSGGLLHAGCSGSVHAELPRTEDRGHRAPGSTLPRSLASLRGASDAACFRLLHVDAGAAASACCSVGQLQPFSILRLQDVEGAASLACSGYRNDLLVSSVSVSSRETLGRKSRP